MLIVLNDQIIYGPYIVWNWDSLNETEQKWVLFLEVAFQLLYFVCKSLAEVVTACLWSLLLLNVDLCLNPGTLNCSWELKLVFCNILLPFLLPVCKHVIGGKVLPTLPKEIDKHFLLKLTLSHDLYYIKIFLLI